MTFISFLNINQQKIISPQKHFWKCNFILMAQTHNKVENFKHQNEHPKNNPRKK